MLRATIHRLGRWYLTQILKSEAESQKPRAINERPIELAFLFQALSEMRPARVLDVGPGTSPLPAVLHGCGCHVTAIDNISDYWSGGMFNRYWHVIDEDIRSPSGLRADFDFISCISVIEHIHDAAAAFGSMIAVLKPGGHLVLTMPYNETKYVEDVYKLPGGDLGEPQDYRCASYNRAVLDQWLAGALPARIVRQDYWQFWSGDVWRQGHRLTRSIRTSADRPHQLTCALIQRD